MSQPLTRPIGLSPGAVRGAQTTQVVAEPAGHVVTMVFSNLLALSLVLLAVNVFDVLDQSQSAILIPAAIFACCLLAAFKLIRKIPITMLTTYPWVLLVVGFFHGLGSLAPTFASRETVTYLSSSFSITPDRLMRTNTLNLVGLASLCVGVLVGNALGGASRSNSRGNIFRQIDPTAAAKMAKVALAIGLPVQFFLRLPAQFGWLPFLVPGSVQQLATFVHVALIILAYLSEKKYPGAKLSLAILVPLVLLAETITFSKEAALMVVVMPFIGFFLAAKKLSRLAWGGVACAIVYIVLVPVVSAARTRVSAEERSVIGDFGIPLDERISILGEAINQQWFTKSVVSTTQTRTQFWWSRLCYNSVQAFAMNQYDQGRPGNSLEHAFATLVPRILWKDKPITALVGIEFQQLYTRRWNDNRTSVAVGVFGEGYWLGGWIGVIAVSVGIGLQLAIMSNLVFKHERQGDVMAYIFCFLYGIITARAIDRWIVMSFIGNIPIYVALYLLSMFAAKYTAKRAALARQRVA